MGIKAATSIIDEELFQEAKNELVKLNNQEKKFDNKRLYFKRDKDFEFDFRDYRPLEELFQGIYYRNISINEAKRI